MYALSHGDHGALARALHESDAFAGALRGELVELGDLDEELGEAGFLDELDEEEVGPRTTRLAEVVQRVTDGVVRGRGEEDAADGARGLPSAKRSRADGGEA